MDGHRHTDAVTDEMLERDVEAMLAVEPSPEFLARVRSRVADEPASSRWHFRWDLGAAAAVVMIIAIAVVWWPRESTPLATVSVLSPLAAPVPAPEVRGLDRTPVPSRVAQARVARADGGTRTAMVALPEVIISENERRAFTVLMTNIRQMRFELPLPTAPDPGAPVEVNELPTLAPVTLDPIEIKPIVELVTLE